MSVVCPGATVEPLRYFRGPRAVAPVVVVAVQTWGMTGDRLGFTPPRHAETGPFLRLCDTYRKADWLKVRDANGQVCIVRRKAA